MIKKMDANKHFKDWYFSYDMEKHEGESEEYSAKELIDFAESYYEARTKLKNNGDLGDVSNNENDSEVAFCDSPIHDFDRCPLIKQTNNCKNCRYYN